MSQDILCLNFWETKLILCSLEIQLFMPNSFPCLLCTTHSKFLILTEKTQEGFTSSDQPAFESWMCYW